MKKILILLLAFISTLCWGHELLCGTPSLLEDSTILSEMERIRHFRSQNPNNDTIYFQIQVHIIRNSNHTTSLNLDSLKKDLQDLNLYFKPAALKFYMCNNYAYIDNDQYYLFHSSDEAYLRQHYNNQNAINIYFAGAVYHGGKSVSGYSYRPTSNDAPNFTIIANNSVRKKTLMHEIGHFFNLLHTHDTIAGHELVNGSNCGIAGDFCCDTPADPGLSDSNVNMNCQYTGTSTDSNGDLYMPDPHNIMSYARKKCRNLFTDGQYQRIRDAANLNCRQNFRDHCTHLENESLTSDTVISNDYVVIKNYYMDANEIIINACQSITMESSVTLQKGVLLQTNN